LPAVSIHQGAIISLPTVPTDGSKHYTDYTVYETAHALQYDLLRNAPHRATQADIEGFAETCSDLVYNALALVGKDAPKRGGETEMLWFDTIRRDDPETVAGGSYGIGGSAAYFQPTMGIGEGSFLLARSQTGTDGVNGLVAHENAIFAAEFATRDGPPLSADDRRRAWDASGFTLDGQSAGGWMPQGMIADPIFTKKAHLIAWPVYPQYPAQMMVQAFVVTGTDEINHPIGEAVTSGPVTITVKDTTGHPVLPTLTPDLSQTVEIGGYTPNLQNMLPQGTYTVFANATINSTLLESKFTIANIPSNLAGLNGAAFPGQYVIAVDNAGNANGGNLAVTRGSVVWSMPGFAIVKPDSTGTFDVTGPSGTKHTYTAPIIGQTTWARFIPVE
jgi:hypothetical protein